VQANESVRAVEGLRVQTPNGKTHRVRAQRYVLACGAIQNARLLLASNRQVDAGLGNQHDLVGRHFMEHIEMPGAQLILSEPQPLQFYMTNFRSTEARGELTLSAEAQQTHRILNGTASLSPGVYDEIKGTFQQLTPEFIKQSWNRSGQEDRGFPELSADTNRNEGAGEEAAVAEQPAEPILSRARAVKLFTRQEQAPNPASRVTLSDETDALGMPRVVLDWQLTALDKRSMRTFYEVLGRQVGQHGIGRVQLLEWLLEDDNAWPDFVSGGWHHMGTARMHDDPAQGVVDANSKVHGLGNLYVAGSAVYPTSGAANPTLTLIALTLRLSDHLKTTSR
jgi:choline dehydrogenase-like flavoprotein